MLLVLCSHAKERDAVLRSVESITEEEYKDKFTYRKFIEKDKLFIIVYNISNRKAVIREKLFSVNKRIVHSKDGAITLQNSLSSVTIPTYPLESDYIVIPNIELKKIIQSEKHLEATLKSQTYSIDLRANKLVSGDKCIFSVSLQVYTIENGNLIKSFIEIKDEVMIK